MFEAVEVPNMEFLEISHIHEIFRTFGPLLHISDELSYCQRQIVGKWLEVILSDIVESETNLVKNDRNVYFRLQMTNGQHIASSLMTDEKIKFGFLPEFVRKVTNRIAQVSYVMIGNHLEASKNHVLTQVRRVDRICAALMIIRQVREGVLDYADAARLITVCRGYAELLLRGQCVTCWRKIRCGGVLKLILEKQYFDQHPSESCEDSCDCVKIMHVNIPTDSGECSSAVQMRHGREVENHNQINQYN